MCGIFPSFEHNIVTSFNNILNENGIQTVIHYPIPPHKQEAYLQWNHLSLPVTESIHKQVVSIPISPVMNQNEVLSVVEVINNYNEF